MQVAPSSARKAVPKTAIHIDVPREARASPALEEVVNGALTVDFVVDRALYIYAKGLKSAYKVRASSHDL